MIDLQPMKYCTSMWNGHRCTGEHFYSGGVQYHVSRMDDYTGEPGQCLGGAQWTDGGINHFLDTGWHVGQTNSPTVIDLGRSPLSGEVWTPFRADGARRDLAAEGWQVLGALSEVPVIGAALGDYATWCATLLNGLAGGCPALQNVTYYDRRWNEVGSPLMAASNPTFEARDFEYAGQIAGIGFAGAFDSFDCDDLGPNWRP